MTTPSPEAIVGPRDLQANCEAFVRWLEHRVLVAARGDEDEVLEVAPSGRYWLARLAPQEAVLQLALGDRGERLDPCATGLRVKPRGPAPWDFDVRVGARCWIRAETNRWVKSEPVVSTIRIRIDDDAPASIVFGADLLAARLREVDPDADRAAEVRVDVELAGDGRAELTVTIVNTSPQPGAGGSRLQPDPNLYEVTLALDGLETEPYLLESMPDSFRYNREIEAYGVNCGAERIGETITSVDAPVVDRCRPRYWHAPESEPDLSFAHLGRDPIPSLRTLVRELESWGDVNWADEALVRRSEQLSWSPEMLAEARAEGARFDEELGRIRQGVEIIVENDDLRHAFMLMNEAMEHSANGRYAGWRPFQIGFLLCNLVSLTDPGNDADYADIVWFATGGGKTETYLGLLVTAALYDRMRGKSSGITAWSRFPLRMLSLQQTQRFADAMAGAELARRRAGLDGDPFSVGFLVGMGATPNYIRPEPEDGQPDPDDDDMPARFQVLLRCPFCHSKGLTMAFNRRYWRLEHRCGGDACPWPERSLPFYVVDEEIYRFLPTVVVGTLDKAASISLNAAMRGFVGPPHGICSEEGHGYAYAPRSSRPNGCLVPGCRGSNRPLTMARDLFAPRFRLQDELHLLRDSLGAVDAHYEALLDELQEQLTGHRPKVLASSATLTGFQKQVDVIYKRKGRVFPLQGPSAVQGFWTSDTDDLARRFVAVAPRGVTVEYTVDRMVTVMQNEVRRLITEPEAVCKEASVDSQLVPQLLSLYGTDVVYGNSLRDLDAATRSLETQVPVYPPPLNAVQLTGRTDFDTVRKALEELDNPPEAFEDRIHVIAASSMMSHGVDIDRLNAMVVLGIPLTTAEFIQTTARVGRRHPALVFVVHKIARERDASVYRSFASFVRQGDRFVEPVPVTRRSRRVLHRTVAGLEMARILALHEPRSGVALSTVRSLRQYFNDADVDETKELEALVRTLSLGSDLDQPARSDLERWVEGFFANLLDPAGTFRFPSDLCVWGKPMISLRDVEEQAPVRD